MHGPCICSANRPANPTPAVLRCLSLYPFTASNNWGYFDASFQLEPDLISCESRRACILKSPAQSMSNTYPCQEMKHDAARFLLCWCLSPPAPRILDWLRRFLTAPCTRSSGARLAFVRPSGVKSCFGPHRKCGHRPAEFGPCRSVGSGWLLQE
jgi:hypothetical protein